MFVIPIRQCHAEMNQNIISKNPFRLSPNYTPTSFCSIGNSEVMCAQVMYFVE